MNIKATYTKHKRMRRVLDKGRREVEDYVFLKIQSNHFRSLTSCSNEKLNPHFYGSYEVVERIGKIA